MGTLAQNLKDGVPVSAGAITPTDRAVMVGDGTSFVAEPNPVLNLKNTGEVRNAIGNAVGSVDININLGNVVTATVTGPVSWSFINPKTSPLSCTFTLALTNGGSAEQVWPASVRWPGGVAPTLSSGLDVINFTTYDGGVTWYGSLAGAEFNTPGQLFVWGSNNYGQLGFSPAGPTVVQSVPIALGSPDGWTRVVRAGIGFSRSLGIKQDKLFAWGYNQPYGALGLGDMVDRSSPVQVGSETGWSKPVSNESSSAAIKSGKLFVWGGNNYGELATGDFLPRSSPVQVGAAIDWTDIAGGQSNFVGIRGGKLFAWGKNQAGQLGLGDIVYRSSPVQVGSDTNWTAVSCNNWSSFGINGGKLFSWGYNLYGELGLGDSGAGTYRSSPTQVGAGSDWAALACGSTHTLGVRGSIPGTLFSWGHNPYGQLGIGNTYDQSSPVQVGADADWSTISGGSASSSGIRGGRLFVWGQGSYSRLADGTIYNKSSPIQIGGASDWVDASMIGATHICGIRGKP